MHTTDLFSHTKAACVNLRFQSQWQIKVTFKLNDCKELFGPFGSLRGCSGWHNLFRDHNLLTYTFLNTSFGVYRFVVLASSSHPYFLEKPTSFQSLRSWNCPQALWACHILNPLGTLQVLSPLRTLEVRQVKQNITDRVICWKLLWIQLGFL